MSTLLAPRSRVVDAARAMYDASRHFPGAGWDTADGRRHAELYMADARVALMADDPTFGACRVCGAKTRIIASFGPDVPYPNVFSVDAPRSPVRVQMCDSCVLPQLEEVVPPAEMFTDYPYLSSQSTSFVEAAKDLVERQILDIDSFVVEIGSNDGYLLRHYKDARVLGVDPSNVESDVPTIRAFFDDDLAHAIVEQHGRADRVHANNVIAHCPDPHALFAGIRTLLADDGVAIIESPYVDSLVDGWDTIYQEHVFYWSATALCAIAAQHGLSVVATERLWVHGGSMRYYLRPGARTAAAVDRVLEAESHLRLDRLSSQVRFDSQRLRDFVAANGHKVICGYGAAAKGSVLCHVTGIEPAFVCDTTPTKQGKVMPGTSVPVVAPRALEMADIAILFAWNFQREIKGRESWWGGEWVHPHEVAQ